MFAFPCESGLRFPLGFPSGKREQAKYRRAPGERFGYLFREGEVLGTCQKVLTGFAAVFVDSFLDIGKQIGNVLYLVENDRRRIRFQKAARVVECDGPDVRRFKGSVSAAVAEEAFEERRLAGLAWSGQNDSRKLGGGFSEDRFQGTFDVILHFRHIRRIFEFFAELRSWQIRSSAVAILLDCQACRWNGQ